MNALPSRRLLMVRAVALVAVLIAASIAGAFGLEHLRNPTPASPAAATTVTVTTAPAPPDPTTTPSQHGTATRATPSPSTTSAPASLDPAETRQTVQVVNQWGPYGLTEEVRAVPLLTAQACDTTQIGVTCPFTELDQAVTAAFPETTLVTSIGILNGEITSQAAFFASSRPAKVSVQFSEAGQTSGYFEATLDTSSPAIVWFDLSEPIPAGDIDIWVEQWEGDGPLMLRDIVVLGQPLETALWLGE